MTENVKRLSLAVVTSCLGLSIACGGKQLKPDRTTRARMITLNMT